MTLCATHDSAPLVFAVCVFGPGSQHRQQRAVPAGVHDDLGVGAVRGAHHDGDVRPAGAAHRHVEQRAVVQGRRHRRPGHQRVHHHGGRQQVRR
jgi:hypothetical protein